MNYLIVPVVQTWGVNTADLVQALVIANGQEFIHIVDEEQKFSYTPILDLPYSSEPIRLKYHGSARNYALELIQQQNACIICNIAGSWNNSGYFSQKWPYRILQLADYVKAFDKEPTEYANLRLLVQAVQNHNIPVVCVIEGRFDLWELSKIRDKVGILSTTPLLPFLLTDEASLTRVLQETVEQIRNKN